MGVLWWFIVKYVKFDRCKKQMFLLLKKLTISDKQVSSNYSRIMIIFIYNLYAFWHILYNFVLFEHKNNEPATAFGYVHIYFEIR